MLRLNRIFLNFIGACLRWLYGSAWRFLFNKPKFTFKDYLYGLKSSDDFEKRMHVFNNCAIGLIFLGIVFFLISR